MVSAATENPTTALISLQPRQVMLKKRNMEKKDFSETPENCSIAKTLEPKEEKEKKKNKRNESSRVAPLILHSIASYLDSNGFSKTLSALRSEAPLEIDEKKVQSLDLEALCREYLETSDHPLEANIKDSKEQDSRESLVTQHDEEPTSKKKKKKSKGSDANVEAGENLLNGDKPHVENKEKKNESESKKSKSDTDNYNMLLEEPPVKSEKKKKKSKPVSNSLGQDNEQIALETIPEAAKTMDPVNESSKKSKDKKGKDKLVFDPCSEKIQQDSQAASHELIKEKPKDMHARGLVTETPLDETDIKHKYKKKMKKKKGESLASEHTVDLNGSDTKMETVLVSEENDAAIEMKSSKKRKRPAIEELNTRVDDDIAYKESEPSKIDSSSEKNGKEQLPVDGSLQDDGHLNQRKRGKYGISEDHTDKHSSKQLDDLAEAKKYPSAHGSEKDVDGLANGNLGKNGKDITSKTTKKEHNGSAEPKKVNAFQRVKVDEVTFVDERLQDNSYWAKHGADNGYGAKAQEVLGQVKGKDFRHEKTKKKRGSYRGGQIDLGSHSIKFNYSDDE